MEVNIYKTGIIFITSFATIIYGSFFMFIISGYNTYGLFYISLSIIFFLIYALFGLLFLRCPRCGLSIYARRSVLFGYLYGPWVGRHCARCGLDFTKERFRFRIAPWRKGKKW